MNDDKAFLRAWIGSEWPYDDFPKRERADVVHALLITVSLLFAVLATFFLLSA